MLINSHTAVWKKNEVLQDRVMRPWFVGRLLISLIVDWLLCFCSAALFIQSQMLVHWWWCWLCHWWTKLLRIGCATKLRHHLHPVLHWIVVVVDRERTVQCQSFIWMQPPNAYKYRVVFCDCRDGFSVTMWSIQASLQPCTMVIGWRYHRASSWWVTLSRYVKVIILVEFSDAIYSGAWIRLWLQVLAKDSWCVSPWAWFCENNLFAFRCRCKKTNISQQISCSSQVQKLIECVMLRYSMLSPPFCNIRISN